MTKEKKTVAEKSNYLIGCSGYYYSNWKNKFYPKGVAAKDYLQYYSSVFNTVELNGTFYRTPTLAQLKKYDDATGEGFSFSVKMSKYITHVLRLQESGTHIQEFQSLIREGLQEKVKCFLFQFPASFQYNEGNLERILKNIPHHPENVIELRHASWWNNDVIKAFKEAKLTFCNVDFPGLDVTIEQSSDIFYFRFHGNPVLFKSAYSVEQLKSFYQKFPKGCRQYWIYFNNTYYEAGYTNAQQLMEIVAGEGPQL